MRAWRALLGACLLAVAGGGPLAGQAAPGAQLLAADLGGYEPRVAEQIEAQRAEIRRLLAAAGDDPGRRPAAGAAFGLLGQLHLVYEAPRLAEQAFVEARRLDPDDPRWPYYLGVLAQGEGDLGRAREMLSAALALAPEDAATLLRLAEVEAADGNPPAARRRYEQALAADPEAAAAALHGLGLIAAAAGDPGEAARRFEEALELDPEASAVRYPLGLAYRDLGERERAAEQLARRGGRPPRRPDPLMEQLDGLAVGGGFYVARAVEAAARGDAEQAVALYRQALEVDPDDLVARRALASLLARSGDDEGAMAEYRRLLAEDPDNAMTRYNLALLHSQAGERQRAMELLEEAVRLSPDFENAHFNLARLRAEAGDLEGARASLDSLLAVNPLDLEARTERARLLAGLGRGEEARRELEEVLAVDPGHLQARLALAEVHRSESRPDRALEVLAELTAESFPAERRAWAHFQVGRVELAEGRTAAAAESFARAVRLQPGAPTLVLALADARARAGLYAAAADAFDQLVALAPERLDGHLGRALAALRAGDEARARAGLEESLAALPEEAALQSLLARVLAASHDAAVRDGPRALELAGRALAASRTAQHAETLAMALAEVGRWEEAVRLQEQLLAQAAEAAGPELVAALRARLELYRRRQPARAPWAAPAADPR